MPSSPRLHARFLPRAARPEVMPQPEAYQQAKALLERRGFDDYVEDDFDDAAGWFSYTEKNGAGRRATVVIGTRTRTVVRAL
jgi:hypothetical protein